MHLREPWLQATFRQFLVALASEAPVYIVGGWLRDTLIGRAPVDADFATAAQPEVVERLVGRHGLKIFADRVAAVHGTWRLTTGRPGEVLDLARLREDVARVNARHAEVRFTVHIERDLARRDLTMNALAVPFPFEPPPPGARTRPAAGQMEQARAARHARLIDLHGGHHDLRSRCLRLIGVADARLHEDPLRLLRVLRFLSAGRAWWMAPATWTAVRQCAPLLSTISRERMRDEWRKSLAMPKPARFWRQAARARALDILWHKSRHRVRQVGAVLEAAASRNSSPSDQLLAVALTMAEPTETRRCPEPMRLAEQSRRTYEVAAILRSLRLPSDELRRFEQLARRFPWRPGGFARGTLATWLLACGEAGRQDIERIGHVLATAGLFHRAAMRALSRRIRDMLAGGAVPRRQDFAIDGIILQNEGVSGPALGALLQAVCSYGIERGVWRDPSALLARARFLLKASPSAQESRAQGPG